jgi:hypothetical protein
MANTVKDPPDKGNGSQEQLSSSEQPSLVGHATDMEPAAGSTVGGETSADKQSSGEVEDSTVPVSQVGTVPSETKASHSGEAEDSTVPDSQVGTVPSETKASHGGKPGNGPADSGAKSQTGTNVKGLSGGLPDRQPTRNKEQRDDIQKLKAKLQSKEREFQAQLKANDAEWHQQLSALQSKSLARENSLQGQVSALEADVQNLQSALSNEKVRLRQVEEYLDQAVVNETARAEAFDEKVRGEKAHAEAYSLCKMAVVLQRMMDKVARQAIDAHDFSDEQKAELFAKVSRMLDQDSKKQDMLRRTAKAEKSQANLDSRLKKLADQESFIQDMYQKLLQWKMLSGDPSHVDRTLKMIVEHTDVAERRLKEQMDAEKRRIFNEGKVEGYRQSEYTRSLQAGLASGSIPPRDPRVSYLNDPGHRKHPRSYAVALAEQTVPAL